MFSKACEYGIRATIYIAMQSKEGNRVSLKDIADQTNSPVAFTAKIFAGSGKRQYYRFGKRSNRGI